VNWPGAVFEVAALAPSGRPGADPARRRSSREDRAVTISIADLQPIVALLAGILILLAPRILNYIVAAYLIVVGLIGIGLIR
jgi:hypothetical protein